MWNMLNCAEQVQIQKYKTHANTTPKTADVQTIMLKHPTKQFKKKKKTNNADDNNRCARMKTSNKNNNDDDNSNHIIMQNMNTNSNTEWRNSRFYNLLRALQADRNMCTLTWWHNNTKNRQNTAQTQTQYKQTVRRYTSSMNPDWFTMVCFFVVFVLGRGRGLFVAWNKLTS